MAGFGHRLSNAIKCFFSILGSGSIPSDVATEVVGLAGREVLAPAAVHVREPTDGPDRAVQVLALLQRDARFVDFVTEDISAYSDEQVGAAVRSVHASCRQVLSRYFELAPILDAEEGASVEVDGRLDPAEIKIVGNVRGASRGVLQHRGWRVTAASLPPLPDGSARTVLAQAEVEVP